MAELIRVSPVADELGQRFAEAGYALYLVGGSVRDALLGRACTDLDFTTDARPEQVLLLTAGWADAQWDVGITFGTVGLQKGDLRLEITTYRSEAYRHDSRNPQVSYGESLEDDLGRRDFTVNAMAVALPGHQLVDPYGGLRDLAAKLLRTPGRPQVSFSDDPLRMLRVARLAAQLGFAVESDVIAATTEMADRLAIVSAERIRDELTKLVCSARPRLGLELLVDTGLADVVLPELPALRLEIDEHHQHKDVYVHTLTVLEQAITLEHGAPDLVLRLAAVLHDVGKARTRAHTPGGGVSFHHHEVVGAAMARKRLTALRYPKQVVEDVARLVFLHLRFHGYGDGEWTDSAVRRYVTDAGPLLDRLHKLTRSDCTTRNRRRAAALSASYDDLQARITRLSAEEDLKAIRPDLDGNEIQAVLGIGPGPVVGQAWHYLKELRLDRGPLGHDEAVTELKRWASERGVGGESANPPT